MLRSLSSIGISFVAIDSQLIEAFVEDLSMAARPSWDVETESESDADSDRLSDGLSDDDADLTPAQAAERLFEYLEDSFFYLANLARKR